MLNNGKIISVPPLMLSDYTIYNQLALLMFDLHKKNKLLVCFQAIWKSLSMLSSPVLFDRTKLFAFPWRLDCVDPSQMRCHLSRWKATGGIEYLIRYSVWKNAYSYSSNPGFLLFLLLSDSSFPWILLKKIIITILGLDGISDSFKKVFCL